MLQSMKTRSTRKVGDEGDVLTGAPSESKSASIASEPFHADCTSWPICSSIVLTTSMLNSLSSATRMRSERSACL